MYVAATAPKMQALAGEIADGCLTPSITTPAFVRYTRENVGRGHRHRLHGRRVDRRGPRRRAATAPVRSPACTSRTRCRTSRARRTRCSTSPGSSRTRFAPSPRRWSAAGGWPRRPQVTDELLDKCKPIAGTPADCIAAIEEYRDAGCTHVMLELWGAERHEPDPAVRRARAPAVPMIRRTAARRARAAARLDAVASPARRRRAPG